MKKPTNASAEAAVTDAGPQADTLLADTPAAPADVPADSSAPSPTAPERPTRGGSYLLQADGSLVLREETVEPSLIELVAAEQSKEADNG